MNAQRRLLIGALLIGLLPHSAIAQEVIDMQGRTALITGSTSGLGENVARRLGAMGAIVIIHGLNEERGQQIAAEITKKGPGRCRLLSGRSGSLKQVDALAERVKAAHPRLELLITMPVSVVPAMASGAKVPMAMSWCSRSITSRISS